MTGVLTMHTGIVRDRWLLCAALVLSFPTTRVAGAIEFPGPQPGPAQARVEKEQLVFENAVLRASWTWVDGHLCLRQVSNRITGESLAGTSAGPIVVRLASGGVQKLSLVSPGTAPALQRLQAQPEAIKRSLRSAGWQATIPLQSAEGNLRARWQASLRDDANYVTIRLVLDTQPHQPAIDETTVLDLGADGARVLGKVDGSPVVAGELFTACEHPNARNRVESGRILCSSRCSGPLAAGESWVQSLVLGVVPPGQLRRGFLYYVERERARPYQLFLHYNSWWDIAWPDRKMNQEQCQTVIEIFGQELVTKRGVPIGSFCFDDGWDDNKTLWRFHKGFPDGFKPLQKTAETFGSAVGTWLSPWGGYSTAKAERLKFGKRQGFETNPRGFSLAGPKYYARFRDICAQMIRDYGVNYFKFDGIAQGIDSSGAGAELAADVEALLRLSTELRQLRPDLYLSMTTGTWPSPYWLWYGDSVWRNGHDWNVHGAGSMRQRWITYRDMITHRMIVRRAPLYPLNSLMIVSVCYAQLGTATKMTDDVDDLIDEMRMAFGGGTQLAELYVTPQMMQPKAWDALAECVRWSRENADVLVDAHWIGGDPGEGQAYGYAGWSPRKGILVLRNPADVRSTLAVDAAIAFELPAGAAGQFSLRSRWSRPGTRLPSQLQAGQTHRFQLEPFEILVLEALPQR